MNSPDELSLEPLTPIQPASPPQTSAREQLNPQTNNEPKPVTIQNSNEPKIPRAVSRLLSHNSLGKTETTLPIVEKRITRSTLK